MSDAGSRAAGERFRPLRIWRGLDAGRRLKAAQAFWKSPSVKPEEIEAAITSLAAALHFRPQSVRTAPLARRAGWLASHAGLNDHLAGSLLYAYHLTHQIPMMARFLELLGIPHEEGRIVDDVKPPDRKAVEAAVETLLKEYDASDVIPYLETLVSQDEASWQAVAEVVEARFGG